MNKLNVYLDNNATTPLHPQVKDAIINSLDAFGNASSFHEFGRKARKLIEDARESVASFIGAETDEIIFLGSGSEANNTVLNIFTCFSSACMQKNYIGTGIITSAIEHPCILETSKCIKHKGNRIFYAPVDEYGKVDISFIEKTLRDEKIALVSIMMANNEVGTIQDIVSIAKLAHKYGAFCHTDAVQALGKLKFNVKDINVDFLSLSAHKVYGPKGVGALYTKKGTPYCPFITGGHQEKGRRAGTENTIGIIGFGKAVELLKIEMDETLKAIRVMRDKLKKGILDSIPNVKVNGHPADCTPNTLNVSFEGAEGEAILLYLDLEGIAVSTGSACSSGSLDPSHVLLAMGVQAERAHGSIRFSLGRETTEQDINYVLEKLPLVIGKIRKMSTAYDLGENKNG